MTKLVASALVPFCAPCAKRVIAQRRYVGACAAGLLFACAAVRCWAEPPAEEAAPPAEKAQLPAVILQGKGVKDPAWIPYAKSYRAMEGLIAASDPADPIEPRFVLSPLRPDVPPSSELRLRLNGAHFDAPMALDHYWGTVPHSQEARDDDADFLLNAPPGSFEFARIIGLKRTADGLYSERYLRASCERALYTMSHLNLVFRVLMFKKKCKGVVFHIPTEDKEALVLEGSSAAELKLITGKYQNEFVSKEYRFTADEGAALIKAPLSLLAVTPIYEY